MGVRWVGVFILSLLSTKLPILKKLSVFLFENGGDSGIFIANYLVLGTNSWSLLMADLDILPCGFYLDKLLWILSSMNWENCINLFMYLYPLGVSSLGESLSLLFSTWSESKVEALWLRPPVLGVSRLFLSLFISSSFFISLATSSFIWFWPIFLAFSNFYWAYSSIFLNFNEFWKSSCSCCSFKLSI